MFDIKFSHFFDRPFVVSKIDEATRRVLSKFGSYVRTRARRSIRSRKRKSAEPGNPPFSHAGQLKNLIFFQFEPENFGVVVGPKVSAVSKRRGRKTVPELLEYGGTALHWRTGKPSVYRKFPYMEPALRAEAPKFAGLFKDAIK